MLIPEILSAVGISWLVFGGLTTIPAPDGLVILQGSLLIPSILNIISIIISIKNGKPCKCITIKDSCRCLYALALVLQLFVFSIDIAVIVYTYKTYNWVLMPVSFVLLSVRRLWKISELGYAERCKCIDAQKNRKDYEELNENGNSKCTPSCSTGEGDLMKRMKEELDLLSSIAKIFVAILMAGVMQTDCFRSFKSLLDKCENKISSYDIPGMEYDWVWVYVLNTGASILVYICAKRLAKAEIHRLVYVLPLLLSPGITFGVLQASCRYWRPNHCIWSDRIAIPSYMFFNCYLPSDDTMDYTLSWWLIVLLLSQLFFALTIWKQGHSGMLLFEK